MEIIKTGKKFKWRKPPEQKYFNKKKRCKKCGCKFRFNFEDIESELRDALFACKKR